MHSEVPGRKEAWRKRKFNHGAPIVPVAFDSGFKVEAGASNRLMKNSSTKMFKKMMRKQVHLRATTRNQAKGRETQFSVNGTVPKPGVYRVRERQ